MTEYELRPQLYKLMQRHYLPTDHGMVSFLRCREFIDQIGFMTQALEMAKRMDAATGIYRDLWLEPL